MNKYIIAHDVGTSGNKAVLVDTVGKVHATATAPYPIHYPCPDWAEQVQDGTWKLRRYGSSSRSAALLLPLLLWLELS